MFARIVIIWFTRRRTFTNVFLFLSVVCKCSSSYKTDNYYANKHCELVVCVTYVSVVVSALLGCVYNVLTYVLTLHSKHWPWRTQKTMTPTNGIAT